MYLEFNSVKEPSKNLGIRVWGSVRFSTGRGVRFDSGLLSGSGQVWFWEKTGILVRLVLAGFRFFPISSENGKLRPRQGRRQSRTVSRSGASNREGSGYWQWSCVSEAGSVYRAGWGRKFVPINTRPRKDSFQKNTTTSSISAGTRQSTYDKYASPIIPQYGSWWIIPYTVTGTGYERRCWLSLFRRRREAQQLR